MGGLTWSASWRRGALFAVAVAAWLVNFAALARFGTWIPFAVTGAALTAAALLLRVVPAPLLVPSLATIGAGLGMGVVMAGVTHAAYAVVAQSWPGARAATAALVDLLDVGGFSAAARAGLVVVIATSEEVIFRGPIPVRPHPHAGAGSLAAQVVVSSALYAAACLTLGSPLLLLVAFLCGLTWALMRVVSRSLVAPIIAHVVWDLGVLVVWPLSAGR